MKNQLRVRDTGTLLLVFSKRLEKTHGQERFFAILNSPRDPQLLPFIIYLLYNNYTDIEYNISIYRRCLCCRYGNNSEIAYSDNGMLAASQATEAGHNHQQYANLVKSGVLERAGRVVYISPGGLDDVLYWIQQLAKKIIYSHETALFLHRMTGRTHIRYSITVPNSYKEL